MVSSPKDINKKIGHPEDSYIYVKGASLISKSMNKFFTNRLALSGLIFILLLFAFSVLSNFTAPYSYDEGKLKKLLTQYFNSFDATDYLIGLRRIIPMTAERIKKPMMKNIFIQHNQKKLPIHLALLLL